MATWELLASDKLTSAGDALDSGTFDQKDFLYVQVHRIVTGGNLDNEYMRFNGVSATDYSQRWALNGASFSSNTGLTGIIINAQNADQSGYCVAYISNQADQEKIATFVDCRTGGTAISNSPNRQETYGKYVDATNPITSIQLANGGSGDYDTDSELVVWGIA